MWQEKQGDGRAWPGPAKNLFADLLTKPDPKTALLAGKEEVLLCPCTRMDGDLQKLRDGDYDAGAHEATELALDDGVTHAEDPIVWEKKASHGGASSREGRGGVPARAVVAPTGSMVTRIS